MSTIERQSRGGCHFHQSQYIFSRSWPTVTFTVYIGGLLFRKRVSESTPRLKKGVQILPHHGHCGRGGGDSGSLIVIAGYALIHRNMCIAHYRAIAG